MNKIFNIRSLIVVASIFAMVIIILLLMRGCGKERVVNAEVSSTEIMVGEKLSFADHTARANEWFWEFGNGDFSEEQSGEYLFPDEGRYQVRLRVDKRLEKLFVVRVKPYINEGADHIIQIVAPYGAVQVPYWGAIDNISVTAQLMITQLEATTVHSRADSSAIRKLLEQVRNKTPEPGALDNICRDAWQKHSGLRGSRTKIHPRYDTVRYSRHKECPPGEYFLNHSESGNLGIYVSRFPNHVFNVDDTRSDKLIDTFNGSYNNINRGDIALHKGASRFSTGCLTFNITYGGGIYDDLVDLLYPIRNNVRFLNFICIDERNAVPIANNDTETYNRANRLVYDVGASRYTTLTRGTVYNFYRYYDLIEPHSDLNLDA